jgi:hypothetical protein
MGRSALPLLAPRFQMEVDEFENTPTSMAALGFAPQVESTSSAKGLRPQLSREEWERLKPVIWRLYREENMTFPQIQTSLAQSHSFRPT